MELAGESERDGGHGRITGGLEVRDRMPHLGIEPVGVVDRGGFREPEPQRVVIGSRDPLAPGPVTIAASAPTPSRAAPALVIQRFSAQPRPASDSAGGGARRRAASTQAATSAAATTTTLRIVNGRPSMRPREMRRAEQSPTGEIAQPSNRSPLPNDAARPSR